MTAGSGAWRLLTGESGAPALDPTDGATNMATDAALLASVCDGAAPTLRFYRWDPPTLSFGRNQPAAGRYDEAAARERGIAFVRRPTGGQAVLHAQELTYAVVAPVSVIGRPRAAYRLINEALVAGLRSMGVPAELAGGAVVRPGAPDWEAACFRAPAAGEVVVHGEKLVGSAQRCDRRVILQHGSILLSGTQAPAESLLLGHGKHHEGTGSAASSLPGWTTLTAVLGAAPAADELAGTVMEALVEAFRTRLGTSLAPGALSTGETSMVYARRGRYSSREWTWRR